MLYNACEMRGHNLSHCFLTCQTARKELHSVSLSYCADELSLALLLNDAEEGLRDGNQEVVTELSHELVYLGLSLHRFHVAVPKLMMSKFHLNAIDIGVVDPRKIHTFCTEGPLR
jgi:hypothetical protein